MQWGAFLGGLAAGGAAQFRANQEKDRQDAIDKRAQESHDIEMQREAERLDEKRQMKAAAAPVAVEEGAGGMTKPETADNRDVGQPGDVGAAQGGLSAGVRVGGKSYATRAEGDAAAAEANSSDSVAARQAGVLRSFGKAAEAAQLESATLQGKAAKLTLQKHEQDMVNEKLDQRLAQVGTTQELAEHASTLTGKQVSVVTTPDGKKAQLVYTNDKGEQVKYGKEFANTAEGVSREAIGYSKTMPIAQKIQALQHFETFDEQKRHNQAAETHADATLASTDRHQRVMEGISGSQLAIAQDEHKAKVAERDANLMNKLPPVTKLRVEGLQRSIQGVEKALNDADARGDADPKGVSALRVRLAQHQEELDKILEQHAGAKPGDRAGGGAPKVDYMGYGGSAAAGGTKAATVAASAAPAAAQSAARPGSIISAAQAAPAPKPAPTPQNASVDPVLAALGGPSGNAAIDASRQQQIQPLRSAADEFRQAGTQLAAAAKSGDPRAIQTYSANVEQARGRLLQLMQGMPQENINRIMQALGV